MIFFRSKFFLPVLIITLIAVAGFAYFYFFYSPPVNFLIPGVPYLGFYNKFFVTNSTAVSSVAEVLSYFGDSRLNIDQLKESFPQKNKIFDSQLEKLFKSYGYETYLMPLSLAGSELDEIKKFVNPEKKTPVIVFQKRSLTSGNTAKGWRVVIGVFDSKKIVVLHDYHQGYNYEVSYGDFEKMFSDGARAVLAVWPTEEIKGVIKGPNPDIIYPARLEVMDRLGELLTDKAAEAVNYELQNNPEKAALIFKELVNDAEFQRLPSAFQISFLASLVDVYVKLNKIDEAILLIKERVMPLNHNLSEAPEGWIVPRGDKIPYPYIQLSRLYIKKGERDLALVNYEEARKVAEELKNFEHEEWFDELENELGLK